MLLQRLCKIGAAGDRIRSVSGHSNRNKNIFGFDSFNVPYLTRLSGLEAWQNTVVRLFLNAVLWESIRRGQHFLSTSGGISPLLCMTLLHPLTAFNHIVY